MTLALLLTAVTGAWAQSTLNVVEFDVPDEWAGDKTAFTVADFPADFVDYSTLTDDEAKALLNSVPTGNVIIIYGAGASSNSIKFVQHFGDDVDVADNPVTHDDVFSIKNDSKFYYTAEPPVTVAWNASTKTGTFTMPGSDVVLTPIYANAAAFATTGTGSEATTLLPAAAEGVIAGTDASLIAENTGIVANIGETTTAQGTLMYAVSTDATAPALDAFNATVPTAAGYDDAATLYVWYYIKGADAPQGEAATLDNTFNDTEPACLTVQVLTNKFDITFNAANANTIEAGKATVTVDGTDAEVKEGKLTGVKMGSEVKLKAATGYKFRKVEVKKAEAAPAISFSKQTWYEANSAPANFISVSQADAKAAADAEKTQANAPGYVCIYALEGGQYKWIDSHGRTGQHSSIEDIANGDAWGEVYECYSAGDNNCIWFTVEPTN